MRKTKIVCTIGPSSDSPDTLRKMMKAGMNVARLNFSHGTHEDHERRIHLIRKLNSKYGFSVKILQDLEGYRIRVGKFLGKKCIVLKKGQTVFLTNQRVFTGQNIIPFDYEGSLSDIKPRARIFIDDGNLMLLVKSITRKYIKASVIIPGVLKERKGINIPGFNLPFRGFTEKDEKSLCFGKENGVDYIAQSFVRDRKDALELKERIGSSMPQVKIIAKIEDCQGILNFDEILEIADGIMIARGDMGVSVPIYQVPIIQKEIIRKCRRKKKFVITATQMLESMTENPRPTRAEVSDVANAVLDGSGFLMLSGETAVGRYPVEVVEMMDKIIRFTEKSIRMKHNRLFQISAL